jgi:peptidoglycan hydrolase CwlO-like protein
MEDYVITNSLDWQRVRSKLTNSKHTLSIFKRDIDRMLNSIDEEVKKLANLEVIVRNRKSQSSMKYAEEQLEKINKQIKNFNKLYMMALLTHG